MSEGGEWETMRPCKANRNEGRIEMGGAAGALGAVCAVFGDCAAAGGFGGARAGVGGGPQPGWAGAFVHADLLARLGDAGGRAFGEGGGPARMRF